MPKDKERNTTSAPTESSPANDVHDGRGTPFKRVPGPGPNDTGKGAAGTQAIDRLEGGLERVADQEDRQDDADSTEK